MISRNVSLVAHAWHLTHKHYFSDTPPNTTDGLCQLFTGELEMLACWLSSGLEGTRVIVYYRKYFPHFAITLFFLHFDCITKAILWSFSVAWWMPCTFDLLVMPYCSVLSVAYFIHLQFFCRGHLELDDAPYYRGLCVLLAIVPQCVQKQWDKHDLVGVSVANCVQKFVRMLVSLRFLPLKHLWLLFHREAFIFIFISC